MKYYVILTRKDNGKKMSANYHGYDTKREAIEVAAMFNSVENSPIVATIEKK